MAIAAFSLTLCVLLLAGGLLVVSIRSGRILFGETYEPVTLQQELPLEESEDNLFVWIPARLRVLLRLPVWEAQCLEWIGQKISGRFNLPLSCVLFLESPCRQEAL